MNANYTCSDYRQEMVLLALRKQLNDAKLTAEERQKIQAEIAKMEKAMGLR